MGIFNRKPKSESPENLLGLSLDELDRVISGNHHDPHSVLGPHLYRDHVTVRTLRPMADAVGILLDDDTRIDMRHEHGGIFVGVIPAQSIPNYRIQVRYGSEEFVVDDPYRWLPTLGELDTYLITEGRHEKLWNVLGAHQKSFTTSHGEVNGTAFAVWAPNAQCVRLISDHNNWNGVEHPMRSLGASGIWELFVPGLAQWTRYRYSIKGADGQWRDHADPMAQHTQTPPENASVVFNSEYNWNDKNWMEVRSTFQPWKAPISIYEVHLGSWRPGLSYRQLADELTRYLKETGFTHVEFLPVMEHPFGGSWGYQVTSYFAPTSRFGSPDDFRYLVDTLHQNGFGVILDWVPAHFPKDDWALAKFDGTALYEHPDPRRGEHPDWGTYVPNFGRPEVRNFLVASALYWLSEFHIDGLRVDAVASMLYLDYSRKDGEWLPNEHGGRENFDAVRVLQETNAIAYRDFPGIMMIAEESTAWNGVTRGTDADGLGFGFKWNMGWMHDSLEYFVREPFHRRWHHDQLTFSIVYAWSENYILPISHDEVVHGKGSLFEKAPGDDWQKLANIRAYLAFMWAHPGKQLLFMGSEFAQTHEWNESQSLEWWLLENTAHHGVQKYVKALNEKYREHPALWEQDTSPAGFNFLVSDDRDGNIVAFTRWSVDGSPLVCAINFSPVPHERFQLPLPKSGSWKEILNSDDLGFGGSGVVNNVVTADAGEYYGQVESAFLRLPPLGAIWLTPTSS